ncbi:MAG: ankyrin repeat domain-containing protein [Gammaproteobacteria bacterium]|nr:ankyrin repeat domain-containing protein [Gammaproteobacteria bacterium]
MISIALFMWAFQFNTSEDVIPIFVTCSSIHKAHHLIFRRIKNEVNTVCHLTSDLVQRYLTESIHIDSRVLRDIVAYGMKRFVAEDVTIAALSALQDYDKYWSEAVRVQLMDVIVFLVDKVNWDEILLLGSPFGPMRGIRLYHRRDNVNLVRLLVCEYKIHPRKHATGLFLKGCEYGDVDLVRTLIEEENVRPDFYKNSGLHSAVNHGHPSVVKLLISYPIVNPGYSRGHCTSAVVEALESGQNDMIEVFADYYGINVQQLARRFSAS